MIVDTVGRGVMPVAALAEGAALQPSTVDIQQTIMAAVAAAIAPLQHQISFLQSEVQGMRGNDLDEELVEEDLGDGSGMAPSTRAVFPQKLRAPGPYGKQA